MIKRSDVRVLMEAAGDVIREYVAQLSDRFAKSEVAMVARLGALQARLEALPAPERGEQGEQGPAGKDADMDALAGMIEAKVSAEIAIRLAAELESIHGKDGVPGRDGQPGAPGPAGRDGENGKDGRDALDLEDFGLDMAADGRTITMSLKRGETVVQRSVRIPAVLYRGVWREGRHEAGDVVTWGGSAWHCNMDTEDKPGGPPSTVGAPPAWRLMVKEGRPGKDGAAPQAPRADAPVRLK